MMRVFDVLPAETERLSKLAVDAAIRAQVLTYLKLTGLRLALLINFNVPLIKDGIERVIL